MTTARVSWNDYFMGIALSVSTRATCDRQHVGAVIARDKSILRPATMAVSAAFRTATTSAISWKKATVSAPSTPRPTRSSRRRATASGFRERLST